MHVLSAQQESIVGWFKSGKVTEADVVAEARNLTVQALAGTGKTYTVMAGIAVAPEARICYLAFNKKNQIEAAEKIKINPRAEAKTGHALGFAIVLRNRRGAKPDAKRGIEDASRACQGAPDSVIPVVTKLADLTKNIAPFCTSVDDVVNIALDYDTTPDEAAEDKGWDVRKCAQAALTAMMYAKEPNAANTITFTDMVWLPVVMGWARPTYDLVVIDEAQDTNPVALILARKVVKPSGRTCVVGDPNQAIYAFRGADVGSMDRLTGELRSYTLPLTVTRRCPKAVVAHARTLVPSYEAAPEAAEGTVSESDAEGMFKDAKVGDAILSRKNAPLAAICLRFLRNGQRARIEGKDVGAGLTALVRKVAGKGKIGIADFLAKLAKHESKIVAKLTAANGKTMEARITYIEDQCETIRAIAEGCESTAAVVSKIESLFVDSDPMYGNKPPPAIVCSTVHKAKGLEWDKVFVCEDTFYPGGRRTQEEQNIAYVAYTRAKAHLVLTHGIK